MKVPRDLAIPMDRVTWRDGQLLTSCDLRDDQRNGDRLRRLHIRYLHRTWGVVEGLSVSITGSRAFVTPGYALDIEGRELLLPRGALIAAPANISVATTVYLVISHAEPQSSHCGCPETPEIDFATLCPGFRTLEPLTEGTLTWKTVSEVDPGRDVLLARVLVASGQFASGADASIQRHASSMARPRLWSDVTQAGQTGWRDAAVDGFHSIQATIDTSDAGFTQTPTYFASVTPAFALAVSFIASTGPASFTLVLRPILASTSDRRFAAASVERAGLVIAWLAIELAPFNHGGRI